MKAIRRDSLNTLIARDQKHLKEEYKKKLLERLRKNREDTLNKK